MSQILVIFVVLTQQLTFVITPYNMNHCPSYDEARETMRQFYVEHDVAGWSYQCFKRPDQA